MGAPTLAATFAVGIDVGGTFTDLVAIDADGVVQTTKVPSTPADQSVGVLASLVAIGIPAPAVARLAHGTTVVTNLLLERTGARVVLCATAGATDLLRLRRQERASLYDLTRQHPEPLVGDAETVSVDERLAPGAVVHALEPDVAAAVADQVAALHPDIVAIALLHAHADARHEVILEAAIRARLPGIDVVTSHRVLPEIREYERTATTVAEAYARPRVAHYLSSLATTLGAAGYPAPFVVTSSGGMLTLADAATHASSLALSGPSGGIAGAAAVCRAVQVTRALTVDIGGTSADVGVVLDGAPLIESGGDVAGVPLALPRVLVETVSAGGGSIAWIDAGGALRVGPRSAGAVPGPACFGRGGVLPTVTDAQLVLGRIQSRGMAGGVSLDAAAAHTALQSLAAPLGVTAEQVALAIIATADASMARALRRVSVERGLDPRDCTLVPFGGGGPLHACGLAEHMGMTRILVPPHAGVLSALGLALAPERREALASVLAIADTMPHAEMAARMAEVAARVAPLADATREWWFRTRYRGQGHDIEVAAYESDSGSDVAARFAAQHQQRFGFTLEAPVEFVSLRHIITGLAHPVKLQRRGVGTWNPAAPADLGDAFDTVVRGPMSIALPDATLYIAAGWTGRPLAIGGWLVEATA